MFASTSVIRQKPGAANTAAGRHVSHQWFCNRGSPPSPERMPSNTHNLVRCLISEYNSTWFSRDYSKWLVLLLMFTIYGTHLFWNPRKLGKEGEGERGHRGERILRHNRVQPLHCAAIGPWSSVTFLMPVSWSLFSLSGSQGFPTQSLFLHVQLLLSC